MSLSEDEMRELLVEQVEAFGVRGLAKALDVSPSTVSYMATGRRRVSEDMARRMGYQRVRTISYRYAEQ